MPRVELTDRFSLPSQPKYHRLLRYARQASTFAWLPRGTKAWAVMYTVPGREKRARMALGSYPATPLAKARALAWKPTQGRSGGRPREVREAITAI